VPERSQPVPNTEIGTRADSRFQYVSKLPEWEKDLLSGCSTASAESEIETLKELLLDPMSKLMVVSNGGCRNKVGSYGYLVANSMTRQRVWKVAGRARGIDMSA
jgi:hypothetical protein